jgi:tRNA nucleotidyltransferase/poly(A) polymerase
VTITAPSLTARVRQLPIIRKISRERLEGKLFLVGGAIRELALGKLPKDYDFALERAADLHKLEKVFRAESFLLGKKPIQTHRIVTSSLSIDVTILTATIEDDLFRRDFTMNAIAYDLTSGMLLDPLDGLIDIDRKIIRYPRETSITEDPLRMVKAVRHLSVLRGFSLDPALKQAIERHAALIRLTASERVKYELDLIILSREPFTGFSTMLETGLLFEIVPELLPMQSMDREQHFDLETLGHTVEGFRYIQRARRVHAFAERERYLTGYALLFHDLGKPCTFSYDEEKKKVHFFNHERCSSEIAARIMERLRFSTSDGRAVLGLVEAHMRLFLISRKEAGEKATRRLVYKLRHLTPCLVFLTLLDLYGSAKGKENESTRRVRRRCREVIAAYEEWRREPLPRLVTGSDLLGLGFQEGPLVGEILDEIREKQISGEISDTKQALTFIQATYKAHSKT